MSGSALEPVIGLEVHAQLLTASKMFCGCSAAYSGTAPNTHVCAVCGGMPGSLPVVNARALEFGVMAALALECTVARVTKFDRKNYSYPDLPKGYQISQYDQPLGVNGRLVYDVDGSPATCGIIRVHLEEDTGKSTHTDVDGRGVTLVDYNRSGVPLMEIVSAPDLTSPEAARAYFATLRQILTYLRINDGNLEEGSLRADVNVSVRGSDGRPGTKVEIKNLNSFRAVQRALEYEIDRQRAVVEAGGTLEQETRGWSEEEGITVPQRSKEYASDYRYFPEPDIPPLHIAAEYLETVRDRMPELPGARRERLIASYGLSAYTAGVLTDDRELSDYYESVLAADGDVSPEVVANWVTGDLLRTLRERGADLDAVPPAALRELLHLLAQGTITGRAAKTVLDEMVATGAPAADVVRQKNLSQIADRAALQSVVEIVLAENANLVERYRNGKTNVIQALIGKVMAATGGRANPETVRSLIEDRL